MHPLPVTVTREDDITHLVGDPTKPSLAPFGGAKMGRKLGLGVKGVVASLSSHRF